MLVKWENVHWDFFFFFLFFLFFQLKSNQNTSPCTVHRQNQSKIKTMQWRTTSWYMTTKMKCSHYLSCIVIKHCRSHRWPASSKRNLTQSLAQKQTYFLFWPCSCYVVLCNNLLIFQFFNILMLSPPIWGQPLLEYILKRLVIICLFVCLLWL